MSDFITNGELRIEAERLCDENDELRAELKGAQEENAKLREAAERDADVMEALNLSLEEAQAENARLMELCKDLYGQVKTDDSAWEIIRRREDELPCYADHLIAGYDCSLGKVRIADGFADRMRELGIEVD